MPKKAKKPATLEDIFDAVNSLTEANAVDFKAVKEDIHEIKTVMVTKEDLKSELTNYATKEDLKAMETRLVTKNYLDDKLGDLKSNLTVLARKADTKLGTLVDELKETKVLSEPSAKRILALEPFAPFAQ